MINIINMLLEEIEYDDLDDGPEFMPQPKCEWCKEPINIEEIDVIEIQDGDTNILFHRNCYYMLKEFIRRNPSPNKSMREISDINPGWSSI